ncbi:uncharacterized protein LOC143246609 [Tachypleus tridentatus]|uniref:uncharacterized protein LOC143246609 n=1 Tax=Tachypleus tridentatus TaxID=6853 RepID=UPI003FD08711
MDDPEEDNVQNSSLSIPSTSCHQGVVVVFAQPDESSDCECSKEENEKTDNEKMLLQNSSHLRDKDSEEEVSVQFVFDKEDVGKESLSTEPKPKKKLSKKVQKATYLKDDSLSLAICGKNVIPLKLREMVKPRRISSKLKEKWNFMSKVKKQILCPVTSCEKTFSNINGIINHYQWCIGLSGKEFSVCQFCSVPVLTENNSEENHVKSKHPERLHVYKTSRRKGFGKRSTLCSSSEDEINVKKQHQSIKQAQKTLREDNRLNSLVSFSGFEKPRRTYTRENIKPKPIMCNEDSVNSTLNSMLSETNSSSYESTGEDLFVSAFSTPEEYTVQRRKNKENESLPAEMCSSNGSVSSTLSLTETRHQSSPSKLCESGQSTSVENADLTLIDSSEEFDPCASARAESQVKSGHLSVSELDTTYASPPLVQNEDNTDLCNASSSKSSLNLELCNTKTVHEVNAALNENVPGSLLSAFDENDKTSSQNGLSFSESCPVNFTPSRNFNYIERRQLLVTPVLQEEFEPCQKKIKLTHAHDINDPPLNSPNSSIDSEKPNFMHSLELSPSSKLNTDHVIEPEAKSISINLLEASPLADSTTEIASFQNNSPNYSAKSQLIKTSPPVTTSSLGKNSPRGKNKSKGVCTSTPTVLFLRPEIDEHEESSPAEEPPSNSDLKAKNFSTAVSEKDEIEFSISPPKNKFS